MTKKANSFVQQWLAKANEDIIVIERLMEYEIVAKGAVGFHCQQAIEKLLKAFLIYNGKDIARTHNIEFLLSECGLIDDDFLGIDPMNLTDFAVELRYPGDYYEPGENEVRQYYALALQVKEMISGKIK